MQCHAFYYIEGGLYMNTEIYSEITPEILNLAKQSYETSQINQEL